MVLIRCIHDQAIEKIKSCITFKPVLQYYDQSKELTFQSDGHITHWIRAVITQECKPGADASRVSSLTDSETCYDGKEVLAVISVLKDSISVPTE